MLKGMKPGYILALQYMNSGHDRSLVRNQFVDSQDFIASFVRSLDLRAPACDVAGFLARAPGD